LKFNRAFEIEKGRGMQSSGIRTMQPNWLMRPQAPWLARLAGKMVLEVLPAALASVIGGFLFTQYHFGHAAPQLVAVQPASPEMMAMVRDEHAVIMDYLKAQVAAEKRRDAAEDAATAHAEAQARAAADARLADALAASQTAARASAPPVAVAKAAPSHRRLPTAVAAAPHAPLAIALANEPAPIVVAEAGSPGDRLASDPDSLLGKTLDLKDHVVAATRHVVSAIGDVFNSVGGSIGGVMSSVGRPFNSAS
jgi:hypothetical protein